MTIQELINNLKEYPPDYEVMVSDTLDQHVPVTSADFCIPLNGGKTSPYVLLDYFPYDDNP